MPAETSSPFPMGHSLSGMPALLAPRRRSSTSQVSLLSISLENPLICPQPRLSPVLKADPAPATIPKVSPSAYSITTSWSGLEMAPMDNSLVAVVDQTVRLRKLLHPPLLKAQTRHLQLLPLPPPAAQESAHTCSKSHSLEPLHPHRRSSQADLRGPVVDLGRHLPRMEHLPAGVAVRMALGSATDWSCRSAIMLQLLLWVSVAYLLVFGSLALSPPALRTIVAWL